MSWSKMGRAAPAPEPAAPVKLTPAKLRKLAKEHAAADAVRMKMLKSFAATDGTMKTLLLDWIPVKDLANIIYNYCQNEHFLYLPHATSTGGNRSPTLTALSGDEKPKTTTEAKAVIDAEKRLAPVFRSTASDSGVKWEMFPHELKYPLGENGVTDVVYVATKSYILALGVNRPVTKLLQISRIGTPIRPGTKAPYTWEGVDETRCDRLLGAYCTVAVDDDVYVFGGGVDAKSTDAKHEPAEHPVTGARFLPAPTKWYTDRAEMFDGESKTWKEMPPLPFIRRNMVGTSLDGVVYLYGMDGIFMSFDTTTRKYKILRPPIPLIESDKKPISALATYIPPARDYDSFDWSSASATDSASSATNTAANSGYSQLVTTANGAILPTPPPVPYKPIYATASRTTGRPLPVYRYGAPLVAWRDQILICGGSPQPIMHGVSSYSSVHGVNQPILAYSPRANSWTEWDRPCQLLPQPTYSPESYSTLGRFIVTSDDRIFAFWDRGVSMIASEMNRCRVDVYDPYSERWSPGAAGIRSIPEASIAAYNAQVLLISN